MRIPIGLLALACLLVGILPAQVIGPSLQAAASAVLGAQAPTYSLAVWHGWTAPLQMSVIPFISGCLLYVTLLGYFRPCERPPLLGSISAQRTIGRPSGTESVWKQLEVRVGGSNFT